MGLKEFLFGRPPGKSKYAVGQEDPYSAGLQRSMYEMAMGTGPSAAELMMDRGLQQQIAAGRSMAASMPGVSPGLAMRMAGQREAGAMRDVSQQQAIMRAQEQAQAQAMMAQYLQQQDQMRLQQDMYNAARKQSTGLFGSLLGTAGSIGGAMLGGPMGAAVGSQIGGGMGGGVSSWVNPNTGMAGAPQWEDYGF